MDVLAQYHAEMGCLIMQHEGTLERFAGDALMVFFNDPMEVPNPEERAVRMAVAMQRAAAQLRQRWVRYGWELGVGIGITNGYATLGPIGFEERWDYAAIGTVTNQAARLCAAAEDGQILVADRLLAKVEEVVEAVPIGELTLKGFSQSVRAHNVVGMRP